MTTVDPIVQKHSWEDQKILRRQREEKLACDIIDEVRVQLMLKFRFLDRALWRMDLEPLRDALLYHLATDAKRITYDPPRVIARYSESYDEIIRDYLHMVLHCVFRHPFDESHEQPMAWSLTCDIIAETVAMDMCGGRFESADDRARQAVADELKMHIGALIPAKVYALLVKVVKTPEGYRGLTTDRLREWADLFERDSHEMWPANASKNTDESEEAPSDTDTLDPDDLEEPPPATQMQTTAEQDESDGSEDGEQDSVGDSDEAAEEEQDEEAEDTSQESSPESMTQEELDQLEKEWEDISKEIEMNLETFAKEWGEEAGSLMASLQVANRKRHDYSDFLRRFMTVTEETILNHDEFDYIYYTYGLHLYDDIPLIEPLEYKEVPRIRSFVIAIDTSESVRAELVKQFVEHTFAIMKEYESFTTDIDIRIIQCDSKVQADMKIRDLRDIDSMMENFTIRGFGGTDFRPTFDYIQTLRGRGQLDDMKGLIYFTDGLGSFPESPPDYEVAFVFIDKGKDDLPPVPPWACKVVIEESAISKFDPVR